MAQDEPTPVSARPRWILHTSPLQAIDVLSRPMITLGTEDQTRGPWAFCLEAGVKYIDAPKTDTTWIPSEGHTLRGEVERYGAFGLGPRVYLSAEYRWIVDRSTYGMEYRVDTDGNSSTNLDEDLRTVEFGVVQQVHVANVKIGSLLWSGPHWYWDLHTGLGIRWREVSNTYREYDEADPRQELSSSHPFVANTHLAESECILNLSLGCKFGWRF